MTNICEDYLKPDTPQACSVCQGTGSLQKGCGAGIWCAPTEVRSCPVTCYDLVEILDVGSDELLCDLAQHDH